MMAKEMVTADSSDIDEYLHHRHKGRVEEIVEAGHADKTDDKAGNRARTSRSAVAAMKPPIRVIAIMIKKTTPDQAVGTEKGR